MTQWGLDVLFNPAKRHMDEEKRRLQSTREEVGDNSGGKRIDLESGKVTIAKQDEADDTDGADGAAEETVAGRPAKKDAKTVDAKQDAPKKELTPAQERALKRRGRAPR